MKHIVIEAECIYQKEKKNQTVPSCCQLSPKNISIHCLKYNGTICPYLIFGTSKSSLVLTDEKGEAVNAAYFWLDGKISSDEWRKQEQNWLDKMNQFLIADENVK